jgi:hypothetical protein
MRFLHLAPFIAAAMLTANSAAQTVPEPQKQPERFQAKIINHSDGKELEQWLVRLVMGARVDLHSIVQKQQGDKDRKFLDSFNISLDPPTVPSQAVVTLSMSELQKKWEGEKLLEIIDGLSDKTMENELKWDSSIYIGYLGDIIHTDNLHISGENISGKNLQNTITVSESIIIFVIVENVIKSHPTDGPFICDLLSKEGTYLISLRSNNDFSSQLRSDLSNDERSVIDMLTKAWIQRKKENLCPDIGVIDAEK